MRREDQRRTCQKRNGNRRNGNRSRRARKRRRMQLLLRGGIGILLILTVVLGIRGVKKLLAGNRAYTEKTGDRVEDAKPDIDVELLTENPYSRPGTATNRIEAIVIHYTANPGATAMQNRNYFEGLKDSHETKASSHFIVGLEGEIVQCVPTWEMAYASNEKNTDTVSIETCHPDEDGSYTEATYESLVDLTAWLCLKFDLTEEDVIRHYDVTGKNCPKYFVEHEDAWKAFKKDVGERLREM